MPESYEIDSTRELVVCRAWGDLSSAELHEHYRRLEADPAFSPHYAQLADLTQVTQFSVDSTSIETEARTNIFAPGTRRAFVAPRGVPYGLARMFAAHGGMAGQDMQVFTERAPAEAWLGV